MKPGFTRQMKPGFSVSLETGFHVPEAPYFKGFRGLPEVRALLTQNYRGRRMTETSYPTGKFLAGAENNNAKND